MQINPAVADQQVIFTAFGDLPKMWNGFGIVLTIRIQADDPIGAGFQRSRKSIAEGTALAAIPLPPNEADSMSLSRFSRPIG